MAQTQLTTSGVFPITVANAAPGGGTSNKFFFSVGGAASGTGSAVVPEQVNGQTVDVAYVPIPPTGPDGLGNTLPAQVDIVQLDTLDRVPITASGLAFTQRGWRWLELDRCITGQAFKPKIQYRHGSSDALGPLVGSFPLQSIAAQRDHGVHPRRAPGRSQAGAGRNGQHE